MRQCLLQFLRNDLRLIYSDKCLRSPDWDHRTLVTLFFFLRKTTLICVCLYRRETWRDLNILSDCSVDFYFLYVPNYSISDLGVTWRKPWLWKVKWPAQRHTCLEHSPGFTSPMQGCWPLNKMDLGPELPRGCWEWTSLLAGSGLRFHALFHLALEGGCQLQPCPNSPCNNFHPESQKNWEHGVGRCSSWKPPGLLLFT